MYRIMIVEDDEVISSILKKHLSKWNYEIYVAENFVKAQPMTANPLVQLETAAIIYFAALMYYKKRLGG